MAEPTIQLGNGNWAGKSDSLLGFSIQNGRFYEQEFTFNRTTTGTYTDSDGYIQEMPYNLLQYSEDFSQWSLNTSGISSIEANYAASPEGLQNAYKVNFIVQSDSDLSLSQTHTITGGSTYVYSIYIKGEGTNIGKDVVIKSKRQGGGDSAGTTTTQTLTNEWKRINFTTTYAANNINGRLFISSNEATSCLIYGAQAEEGTSAKTYFPTTTRLNMPRVDYLNNSNGSLILEPQRSNLVTYSSDFSQWDPSTEDTSTMTITPNYSTAQNGLSASRLVAARPSTNFRSIISNYVSNANTATKSVYIKNNNAGNVDINISDQAITVTDTWQRYELTNNYPHATIGLRYAGAALSCDISIAGYQFELGSYATSYIPTSGSSVTRNQDTCSITNVADRINSSEGVLFADIAALDNDSTYRLISIENTSDAANNFIYLGYNNSSNTIRTRIEVAGSAVTDMQFALSDETEFNKCAVKWNENDFALWVNGVEVATDSSGSTFSSNTLDRLSFNRNSTLEFLGNVKQLQVYNTALSDSELAVLTGGTAAVYNWVDSSSNRIVNENGDTIIFT